MKYLWINPVTDKMYDKQKLNEFIMQQGYKRVETSKDWLSVGRCRATGPATALRSWQIKSIWS